MSLLQRRPSLRWIAPLLTLGLVVSVPGVVQRVASADPGLEPRTAEQLLADLAGAKPRPLSGTVTQTMNLGLPSLPDLGQDTGSDPLSLLTGTHTWRVWTDAKKSFRVAKVQGHQELTLVHNPTDSWLWDSATREAVHVSHQDAKGSRRETSAPEAPTPQTIAKRVLAAVEPSTAVTTDASTTVAGRPAHQLVLSPKSANTKIGQVKLAIDSATKLPLRVLITARGASVPAVNISYTSLALDTPDPKLFRFTPGKRVTVTEADKLPMPGMPTPAGKSDKQSRKDVKIVGKDWERVLVVTTGSPVPTDDPAVTELLGQFPVVSGDWGRGHLVNTALVSILITDDGRIALGAVQPSLLYSALK